MLRLLGPGARLCDGRTRREILRIGGLGVLGAGLSLPDLIPGASQAGQSVATKGSSFGRAKSCILLFLMGGPPQHSTWDPKPDAPSQVRGDLGPIATSVPGLSLCELLPRTALVADKLCVLRAMSTGDNAHSSSGYYMLTGRPHQPHERRERQSRAAERRSQPGRPAGPGRLHPGRSPSVRHTPNEDLQH